MKLYNGLNNLIAFFILLGFYSILLLSYNIFPEMETTTTSIYVRILIVFLILVIFIIKPFKYNKYTLFLLFIFSIVYCTNICIAMFDQETNWFREPKIILMYYGMYAIVPFLFFAKKESKFLQNSLKVMIINSGILFSFLTALFYSSVLMNFGGRISMLQYILGEETKVINPLIFSYVASITIGLIICELLFNHQLKSGLRTYLYFGCAISLIPFILGASRGSIFSLFLPFIYILFKSKYTIKKGQLILGMLTLISVLLIISNITDSALVTRFISIASDNKDSTSFTRLNIWMTSIEQATKNIIFGHGLQNNLINHYPHNIFIEVLLATGLVGLSIFFVIVFHAFRLSGNIVRTKKEHIWIIIIFQQGLIQSLFTGAIADSIIFWTGIGLIFSSRKYISFRQEISRNYSW